MQRKDKTKTQLDIALHGISIPAVTHANVHDGCIRGAKNGSASFGKPLLTVVPGWRTLLVDSGHAFEAVEVFRVSVPLPD